jgi:ribonuclease BN (tRNA processing enzyme)
MKITVLGSGTAIPDEKRGSPGIAVRSGDALLFLDLGSGSLYRAERFGISVRSADAVLLSHLHPDHTGDLVPLLFAFRNPEWPREEALSLFGPTGLPEFLRDLETTYGSWVAAEGYQQEVKVFPCGSSPVKGVRVSACSVRHGPAAVAYEIQSGSGNRLVYSGDTEYCEELAVFARDADLLVLECSFPEGEERPGHLTPSGAGRIAGRARCRRLLLTHFYPACRGRDLLTPCRRHYDGPITLAEDGLTMEL